MVRNSQKGFFSLLLYFRLVKLVKQISNDKYEFFPSHSFEEMMQKRFKEEIGDLFNLTGLLLSCY